MCWPVDAIAGQARGYSELVVMHENAGKRVRVSMASVAQPLCVVEACVWELAERFRSSTNIAMQRVTSDCRLQAYSLRRFGVFW